MEENMPKKDEPSIQLKNPWRVIPRREKGEVPFRNEP